jgi:hypothetical protein
MLYYRRKILLALLEAFEGRLGKIDLQKLLLLFSKLQNKADFHFVPYQYGCYSYQANWDLLHRQENKISLYLQSNSVKNEQKTKLPYPVR